MNNLYKATQLDGIKESSLVRFKEIYFSAFDGEKVLWPYSKDNRGYGRYKVYLKNGKTKSFLAHRLAWLIFKGDIPEGYVICHKDDNPTNIFVENLFCGTPKDNALDCKNKGRYSNKCSLYGSKNLEKYRDKSFEKRRCFSESQIREIRKYFSSGKSVYWLAKFYGVAWKPMSNICKGITYKHVK